jgi:predicted metalloprotease with PDZ domain
MCEYEVQKVQKNKKSTVASPVDTSKEDEILLLRSQLAERDELIATKNQTIEQYCQTIQELRSEVVELNETISNNYNADKCFRI